MTTQVGTRITSFLLPIGAQLYVMDCGECGIVFAVPDDFDDRRRRDGATFFCPNGHRRVYRDTDQTKLERAEAQLEAARSLAQRERERREHAERQRSAARGQVTKIKNRVKNGVCPCCNRTFADLARHMQSKHPDFSE